MKTFRKLAGLALTAVALGVTTAASADPGTREDRAALFDYILKATLERTAFSPLKPRDIAPGENVTEAEIIRRGMLRHRTEFVEADTDRKLYHALVKLNATRWDSHLKVSLVPGGIEPFAPGTPEESLHAPIKFKPDYGDRQRMFLFVSDVARDIGRFGGRVPEVGDRLLAVNGEPAERHLERLAEFIGRSSHRSLWWTLSEYAAQRSRHVAPELYADGATYRFENRSGGRYEIELPYLEYRMIDWMGQDDQYMGGKLARLIQAEPDFVAKTRLVDLARTRYRGFEHVFSRPAFDLYASTRNKVLLLQGHAFFPETIVADLDALMGYARSGGRLGYAIIYDLTRGGGGDFEEYTLQKLQPQPFKIMFGNLRVSSVTLELAKQLRDEAVSRMRDGSATPQPHLAREVAAPDGGQFLLDWLDRDVAAAIRSGQAYTSDVQFKNQFLPTTSDGYLYPAKEHFEGPMVLFTSPYICSGADQFASMFIDNGLGLSVGMPEGGCSNTWEWEEVLKLPSSGKPVAKFMWTAGHSIRPNGEVLEGNSALPRIQVPLTRENYLTYYDLLMGHALRYIDAQRAVPRREPSKLDGVTDGRVAR